MGRGSDKKVSKKEGMTRREFVKRATYAGAALSVSSFEKPIFAATMRDHILIGRPNPTSGPISAFGESTPWVDEPCGC